MKVNEIFGPTWQGEGSSTGQLCMFLRLSGCNLECSWCDTKYAKTGEELSVTQIVDTLLSYLPRRVVISGGEPLLQQNDLRLVVNALHDNNVIIEVETNGTIIPRLKNVSQYNVSPKLRNAGTEGPHRDVLQHFLLFTNSIFKFVCASPTDIYDVLDLGLPTARVWIMPQGITPAELDTSIQAILPYVREYGFNFTDRLHIRIWGGKRGH